MEASSLSIKSFGRLVKLDKGWSHAHAPRPATIRFLQKDLAFSFIVFMSSSSSWPIRSALFFLDAMWGSCGCRSRRRSLEASRIRSIDVSNPTTLSTRRDSGTRTMPGIEEQRHIVLCQCTPITCVQCEEQTLQNLANAARHPRARSKSLLAGSKASATAKVKKKIHNEHC